MLLTGAFTKQNSKLMPCPLFHHFIDEETKAQAWKFNSLTLLPTIRPRCFFTGKTDFSRASSSRKGHLLLPLELESQSLDWQGGVVGADSWHRVLRAEHPSSAFILLVIKATAIESGS